MAANKGYPMLHNDSGNPDSSYATASPVPASNSPDSHPRPSSNAHRRTYQACIPCRRRKVRCDLGEVDNPHDPPCGRCRREAKECYFSATRRKKKTSGGEQGDDDHVDDDHVDTRNQRKRQRTSVDLNDTYDDDEFEDDRPRTPGGSVGRSIPLRRQDHKSKSVEKSVEFREEELKSMERTTALLQNAEVHGGHDALKLLSLAASHREPSTSGRERRPKSHIMAPTESRESPTLENVATGSFTHGSMAMFTGDKIWKMKTEPEAYDYELVKDPVALKAWSRFRFVRAGWFTAAEGIRYIHYFYENLAPLTPVVLPKFADPSTHKQLLEEEPMLAVTLLLIASRFRPLEGAGKLSRPYALHDKFYKYLDGMIKRVVWGQEQFGGGFTGAGNVAGEQPGCDVNPLTRKGLRTLGTVESLLLLTEWHPRAMHFPPEEDDDELMIPDEPLKTPPIPEHNGFSKGIGGHRMDAWLEPCWRSDRMCWMLTGMAMTLAFEIGVFDSDWQRHARSADGQPLSADELKVYDQRRNNVRDVLLIFTTITSGRVGLTSMLPSNYSKPEDSALLSGVASDASTDQISLHYWLRIAAITRDGNQQIFPNKAHTRQLIRSGQYLSTLDRLRKPLEEWRRQFEHCEAIPEYMRCILLIEYEHTRLSLNAIALQAVVERCVNELQVTNPVGSGASRNVAITPSMLSKKLGRDRQYVYEVADACRNLLRVVVDRLAPGQYLRHAPVRAYFRIISTAMILLKTFAMGSDESNVAATLELMNKTVEALSACVVDDVHVACQFAGLLKNLTRTFKPFLVRMAPDGRAGRSRRASRQPTRQQSPMPEHGSNHNPANSLLQSNQQPTGGSMMTNTIPTQWFSNSDGTIFSPPQPAYSTDAMHGISDEQYDLTASDMQYSVMPPPGFNSSTSPASAGAVPDIYHTNNNNNFNAIDQQEDFLGFPLNGLLQMNGAEIDNSMWGVQIDGQDMLEVLLLQQQQQQQQQQQHGNPGGGNHYQNSGFFNSHSGSNGFR